MARRGPERGSDMTTTKTYETREQMERALDAVDAMAVHWQRHGGGFVGDAADEFCGLVDPACHHEADPDGRELELVSICFTEWLLFEKALGDGMTPLERFCADRPAAMPERMWRALGEVAASQFFSRFAILSKDEISGVCSLEDVRTGERREVWDPRLAAADSWLEGTVGERVARVGGAWLAVGQARLYDRAKPSESAQDGPGEVHPEDAETLPGAMLRSYYLRLLRDVIGFSGRYSASARIRGEA